MPSESKFSNFKSLFFEQAFNSCPADIYYLSPFKFPASKKTLNVCIHRSRVAQWKRAGPITQRSVDRNHFLLIQLKLEKI